MFCLFFNNHSYCLTKGLKADKQEVNPIEMNSLVGTINDLDHTPFRSLRPRSPISSSGDRASSPKAQRPVVCSVAPNLPVRPPSSSDNDSIRKNHWDMDYEGVFPLMQSNVLDSLFYLVFPWICWHDSTDFGFQWTKESSNMSTSAGKCINMISISWYKFRYRLRVWCHVFSKKKAQNSLSPGK